MNNTLGKTICILLLLPLQLFALDQQYCTYTIDSDKSEVVAFEPVHITFDTRQTKHDEVMFFDLLPLNSQDYSITLITEKRYEYDYHDAKKHFEFLLIPKHDGRLSVAFDFQVRRASDEGVAQAYEGGRDNVESMVTIKTKIATPIITLDVHPLSTKVDGVGALQLRLDMDKSSTDAYEAVNVTYTLTGTGYLDPDYEPLHKIDGTSIFRGVSQHDPQATAHGYHYDKVWTYAIVPSKAFLLPSATLSLFDPDSREYRTVMTKSQPVKVTPIDIKTLVDETELPEPSSLWPRSLELFYDLLIFITGFLAARLLDFLPKRKRSVKESCCIAVEQSKDSKALLKAILPLLSTHTLHDIAEELEKMTTRRSSNREFKAIKSRVIEMLGGDPRSQTSLIMSVERLFPWRR